jgi:hypothetical protein
MSHNVQYLVSLHDIDQARFPTATVGSAIPGAGTSVEFELDTPAGEIQCIFSQDVGFAVLWSNINYYRFLYHGEKAEAVTFLDRWVSEFCSRAVRVDGSLLDEWLAGLDESQPSTSDVASFVAWASAKEPEGAYWQRVGPSWSASGMHRS